MIISNRKRNKRIKRGRADNKNKLRKKMDWQKLKEDNLMDHLNKISRS